MTAPLASEDAARLEQCLACGGVAVIPTDTVYGLACNPNSETAVRRLYELKGRPPARPSAVMFFALQPALELLTDLGPHTRAALDSLLPGAATLLIPNPTGRFPLACDPTGAPTQAGVRALADDGPTTPLGLRVPLFTGPLSALAEVTAPAMQSSANLAGGPDPKRIEDVPVQLRAGADLVFDGGELPGTASTVLDLTDYERTGEWRIVREGPIAASAIGPLLD